MPETEKALQSGHEKQKHRLALSAVWLSLFPVGDWEKSPRVGQEYLIQVLNHPGLKPGLDTDKTISMKLRWLKGAKHKDYLT